MPAIPLRLAPYGLLFLLIITLSTLLRVDSAVILTERQDGACGPTNGDAKCSAGFCCSSGGFCGKGPAWCGDGCQVGFGECASGGGGSSVPTETSAGTLTLVTPGATTTASATVTSTATPGKDPIQSAVDTLRQALGIFWGIVGGQNKSGTATTSTTATTSATPLPPPPVLSGSNTPIASWLTQDLFDRLFPYYPASAVYTTDGKPFYTLEAFLAAISWLANHSNTTLRGFATSSDDLTNKLEMAAFLASAIQETGDPSLAVPYPWAKPAAVGGTGPEYLPGAGGMIAIMEGLTPSISLVDSVTSQAPYPGALSTVAALSDVQVKLIGTGQRALAVTVASTQNTNQAGFGLGGGTNTGVIWQPGLTAVSDDGTLYGDQPLAEQSSVLPSIQATGGGDRKTTCLGAYCQYGGRGVQQLSYNFNYAPTSLTLFGDYRLIRYPNLIVTQDREGFHGHPEAFGFPGPNAGGNNRLPDSVASTTPEARVLAWVTSLYFWMGETSSRGMTCHQAMMKPKEYGITSANVIVNRQDGCTDGQWAKSKVAYYRRVAALLGVDSATVESTIICPGKLSTR